MMEKLTRVTLGTCMVVLMRKKGVVAGRRDHVGNITVITNTKVYVNIGGSHYFVSLSMI